ncbi:MAG: 30S ribosomal protein S14 [Candidatus Hodgkinia cicadicola]
MSKLGAINNLEKLKLTVQKYKLMKFAIKRETKWFRNTNNDTLRKISFKRIPRLASSTRIKKRCFVTGRPRGFYNAFGVSRIIFRQMACNGLMPGVRKSSW